MTKKKKQIIQEETPLTNAIAPITIMPEPDIEATATNTIIEPLAAEPTVESIEIEETAVIEEPATVKAVVLIGSLMIEWPIGVQPIKGFKTFSKGDIMELPLERAKKIGTDIRIL